jgi:hypothetical protein
VSLPPTPLDGFRGIDRVLRLTVKKVEDASPQDLTGATIELQIKTTAGAADPALLSKSVGAGITLLSQSGATLGQAEISITAAETQALLARTYKYDVIAVIGGKRRVLVPPSDFVLKELVNQP